MEEKKGFFKRLVEGLTKTRNNIVSGIDSIFSGFSSIDDDFYDEIEEILIMGDLGINATTSIIEDLKRKVKEQHIKDPAECKELLIESIKEEMNVARPPMSLKTARRWYWSSASTVWARPQVSASWRASSRTRAKKWLLAAADTFRAAAGEQLGELGKPGRCGDHQRSGGFRPGSRCLRRHPGGQGKTCGRSSGGHRRKTPQQEKPYGGACESSTGSLKKNIRKLTARPW